MNFSDLVMTYEIDEVSISACTEITEKDDGSYE